jgi:potassium/hydrogen antiporter
VEVQLGVDTLVLVGAVLLLAAVLTAALASDPKGRFRVPGALLFLAIGMVVGEDGLGLSLDDPELVRNIGVVALLFILFEGGLTTKPTDLRLAALPGTLLHSGLGLLVLLVVLVLNVYKPRGLTRYGWRKQQRERRMAREAV